MDKVARGYFGLKDWEASVSITSNRDFLVHIWARNVENFAGGVQILTPPSQFRGQGSSGPQDGLVLDVGPGAGADLGCIGGVKGEAIQISSAGGARVTVFVTLVTAAAATVKMTATPAN